MCEFTMIHKNKNAINCEHRTHGTQANVRNNKSTTKEQKSRQSQSK